MNGSSDEAAYLRVRTALMASRALTVFAFAHKRSRLAGLQLVCVNTTHATALVLVMVGEVFTSNPR